MSLLCFNTGCGQKFDYNRGVYSGEEPQVRLQQKMSSSLRRALEKMGLNGSKHTDGTEEERDEVKVGTSCRNGGCSKSYSGPASDRKVCKHHPGVTVFHEGTPHWRYVGANSTTVNIRVVFEGDKEFEQTINLWGLRSFIVPQVCVVTFDDSPKHLKVE